MLTQHPYDIWINGLEDVTEYCTPVEDPPVQFTMGVPSFPEDSVAAAEWFNKVCDLVSQEIDRLPDEQERNAAKQVAIMALHSYYRQVKPTN